MFHVWGEAYTGFWWGNLRERKHRMYTSIINKEVWKINSLRIIFRNWGYGLEQPGTGRGQVADICVSSNEPSGSIKCGEFLD
jgi:hypothetical protein